MQVVISEQTIVQEYFPRRTYIFKIYGALNFPCGHDRLQFPHTQPILEGSGFQVEHIALVFEFLLLLVNHRYDVYF